MPYLPYLISLLREHSVRWGDFTLKSGIQSDLYVDVRKTILRGDGSRAIARTILECLHPEVSAIGGVELGAVPIIGSIIALSDRVVRPGQGPLDFFNGFIVRKTPKGHGTGAKIENCPPAGTKVAVVEDVTTTGGSLAAAIESCELAGLDVIQVITVVDRQEDFELEGTQYHGAEEFLRAGGYQGVFSALVTRADLMKGSG